MAKHVIRPCLILALASCWAVPALAVVPGVEDPNEFLDPNSPYYGFEWDHVYPVGGGSAVAVGYFRLLTAQHVSIGEGKIHASNGDVFEVVDSRALLPDGDPALPPPLWLLTPDVRVLEVRNTTRPNQPLPGSYPLYTGNFPSSPVDERELVLVGTGKTGWGYLNCYGENPFFKQARRWGTNRFERFALRFGDGSDPDFWPDWVTQTFRMDYHDGHTPHEAGYATGDSGGGVFVKTGGTWKLAGVNLYRDAENAPCFTQAYAASIPYYANSIYQQLDRLVGDTKLNRNVDAYDIQHILKANSYKNGSGWSWEHGDVNWDGRVDEADIRMILDHGLYDRGRFPKDTSPGPQAAQGAAQLPADGQEMPQPEPGAPAEEQPGTEVALAEPDPVLRASLLIAGGDLAIARVPPGTRLDRIRDVLVPAWDLVIRTNGVPLNGFILESDAGLLTGEPYRNRAGLFVTDADDLIADQFGAFGRLHDLGRVVGARAGIEVLQLSDLQEDLTLAYTTKGKRGITRRIPIAATALFDADLDGKVGRSDFLTLKENFGTPDGAVWVDADLTGDGAVDFRDYVAMKLHGGRRVVGDADAAQVIPEPAALTLLALAAFLMNVRSARRRSRRT
jgi:hypothetical protein